MSDLNKIILLAIGVLSSGIIGNLSSGISVDFTPEWVAYYGAEYPVLLSISRYSINLLILKEHLSVKIIQDNTPPKCHISGNNTLKIRIKNRHFFENTFSVLRFPVRKGLLDIILLE